MIPILNTAKSDRQFLSPRSLACFMIREINAILKVDLWDLLLVAVVIVVVAGNPVFVIGILVFDRIPFT